MAANKEAVSFDEIIQTARQRRKQQKVADKFFDKNRGLSGPRSRTESPAPGSLASRVEKPSASAGVQKKQGRSAQSGKNAPIGVSRSKSAHPRNTRESRMLSSHLPAPNNNTRAIRETQSDFNIRGRASGPCVVMGSNFAPGTTAADIQSALEPVGGTMINCRIVTQHPTVAAEMTFSDQRGAESVVSTFNNQTADGRILQIRIKQPPLGVVQGGPSQSSTGPSSFDVMRERADRERWENRRAEPQVQDGRYGFDDSKRSNTNDAAYRNAGTGLYSDTMMTDAPNGKLPRGGRRRR